MDLSFISKIIENSDTFASFIKNTFKDKKFSNESLKEYYKLLFNPVILSTREINRQIKNETFLYSQELIGITSKSTYSNTNTVEFDLKNDFLNNVMNNISDPKIKSAAINLYFLIYCLNNSFTIDFKECMDYDLAPSKDISIDIYCHKCGSKDLKTQETHTRGLDEDSNIFLECQNCNNTFKE